MKIRKGFVSNSSSSSFIVKFPRIPKDVDDCKKILFGDDCEISVEWVKYPTKQIAEIIFNDISRQISSRICSPNKKERIKKIVHLAEDIQRFPEDFEREFSKIELLRNSPIDLAKRYFEKREKGNIFDFTYSDNDGSIYALMEHGNIFKNLEHEVISNH